MYVIKYNYVQRTSKCGGFWFCHFMPLHATSSGVPLRVAYATSSGVLLRVAYATSSGVCHFKWRATSSGVSHCEHATSCHFKWRVAPWACHFMPLQVADATSSGVCHFKWRVARWACHFMPLHATSSGVSHREHATSCHFMPLQVAWSGEIGLRTSCVLNDYVNIYVWISIICFFNVGDPWISRHLAASHENPSPGAGRLSGAKRGRWKPGATLQSPRLSGWFSVFQHLYHVKPFIASGKLRLILPGLGRFSIKNWRCSDLCLFPRYMLMYLNVSRS